MNKKPYNILHILPTGRLQGAERVVQLICRYLDKSVFSPYIVCSGEPLAGIYRDEDYPVEVINVLQPWPGNLLRLRKLMQRNRIDLIHAHDHRASLAAWLAGRFAGGIPLVSHIHNTNPWLAGWHPLKLIEMFMRGRYQASIACSETVKNYYLQFNSRVKKSSLHTVTNGIEILPRRPVARDNLAHELGIPDNHFVYGTVGRLDEQKGMDQLLIAYKEVVGHLDNVFLLIVGAGTLEQELKRLAAELELDAKVAFVGYRADVNALLQMMDAFVLASRWEGLPMVLMEAMAQQLPVIATAVGGVGELVIDGETGLLIAPGDINALAEKMVVINRENQLRQKLALSGYEHVVRNFNVVNQVKKIEAIYYDLLRGGLTCSETKPLSSFTC